MFGHLYYVNVKQGKQSTKCSTALHLGLPALADITPHGPGLI